MVDGRIWENIDKAIDGTRQAAKKAYGMIANVVEDFKDQPDEVKAELMCDFLVRGSQAVGIGAIAAATGVGAAYMGARLATFVASWGRTVAALMPAIKATLQAQNLTTSEKVQKIREIVRNRSANDRQSGGAVGVASTNYVPFRQRHTDQASRVAARRRNASLSDQARISEIEKQLGVRLTPEQRQKFLDLHNIRCKTDTCTAQEIRDNKDLAGVLKMFDDLPASQRPSREQILDLYRANLLGKMDDQFQMSNTSLRSVMVESGVDESEINKLLGDVRYAKGDKPVDLNTVSNAWKSVDAQAEQALRSGDMTRASELYAQARELGEVSARMAASEGNQEVTERWLRTQFAQRGIGESRNAAIPKRDELFDQALEQGTFNRLAGVDQDSGLSNFKRAYDPNLGENRARYEPNAAVQRTGNPAYVYQSVNRQYQELRGFLSYLSRQPYERPPMPEWLQGIEKSEIQQYIKTYKDALETLEQRHFSGN